MNISEQICSTLRKVVQEREANFEIANVFIIPHFAENGKELRCVYVTCLWPLSSERRWCKPIMLFEFSVTAEAANRFSKPLYVEDDERLVAAVCEKAAALCDRVAKEKRDIANIYGRLEVNP